MTERPQKRGLLLVAYWYPPENESGALRPGRFNKYLPRNGFSSSVLAAPLSSGLEPDSNVHRTGDARGPHPPRWFAMLCRVVQRVAPYNDRLEWVAPAFTTGSRVLEDSSLVAVISTSPPVASHITGWLLARRHRLVWIADFRDPIVGNPFRTRRRGRWYDKFIERLIVARANSVIVNTDAALDSFVQRYPRFREKLHLVWNGYDPDDDLSAKPIPPRAHRVLAHFGSVYGARHPGVVLDSLERLIRGGRTTAASIRVRLVGSIDSNGSWLSSGARTFLSSQGCLEYTDGMLPREEARREMAEADLLLLLDLNELGTGVQVPAKLFEYIRIGRPVLALTSRGSPVERILAQARTPHVCLFVGDSEEEVDRKLRDFLALPTEPVEPSAWFHEQFNAAAQTRSLAAIIDSALTATHQAAQLATKQRTTDRSRT
jgi:glycosyltransferase involved in cell wall biosynthesis